MSGRQLPGRCFENNHPGRDGLRDQNPYGRGSALHALLWDSSVEQGHPRSPDGGV